MHQFSTSRRSGRSCCLQHVSLLPLRTLLISLCCQTSPMDRLGVLCWLLVDLRRFHPSESHPKICILHWCKCHCRTIHSWYLHKSDSGCLQGATPTHRFRPESRSSGELNGLCVSFIVMHLLHRLGYERGCIGFTMKSLF